MNTYKNIYTPEKLRAEISSIIESKKLSQLDVCKETGISQSQLSFFLNGKRDLAAKAILRLLEFYFKHQDTQHATETR